MYYTTLYYDLVVSLLGPAVAWIGPGAAASPFDDRPSNSSNGAVDLACPTSPPPSPLKGFHPNKKRSVAFGGQASKKSGTELDAGRDFAREGFGFFTCSWMAQLFFFLLLLSPFPSLYVG